MSSNQIISTQSTVVSVVVIPEEPRVITATVVATSTTTLVPRVLTFTSAVGDLSGQLSTDTQTVIEDVTLTGNPSTNKVPN